MIIRRHHQNRFTVLPNTVFNDPVLSLDEKGALGWLLSRPHDWEVSRAACAKIWGVGREKATRIFRSLVERGWAQREEVRATDGTMLGLRYVVRDEPGDPTTLFNEPDDDAEDPSTEVSETATGVSSQQQTGLPATVEQATAEPLPENPSAVLSNKKILNTDSPPFPPATKSGEAPPAEPPKRLSDEKVDVPGFEPFYDRYFHHKPDQSMSRHAAERVWMRMSDRDKMLAFRFLDAFVTARQKSGLKLPDAKTYLVERRWQGFVSGAPAAKPMPEVVMPGSAEWHRWREYRVATGQSIVLMDQQRRAGRGWTVPTKWPPSVPKPEAGNPSSAPATGPPQGDALMTREDVAELEKWGNS